MTRRTFLKVAIAYAAAFAAGAYGGATDSHETEDDEEGD